MARREFSARVRRQAYDRAIKRGGTCEYNGCTVPLDKDKRNYHFDHILPDGLGGKPELANCQVLCELHHQMKTGTEDVPRMRKADRQRNKDIGAEPPKQKIQSRGFQRRTKKKRFDKTPLPPKLLYKPVETQE